MSALLPASPFSSRTERDATPTCEWVMPSRQHGNDYARTCKPLPPGMPDCLEVHVIRTEEGVERATAVVYGAHVYLVHYAFKVHPAR